jgi:anti-anti-sigma factor
MDGLLGLRNSFDGTSYCVALSGELGASGLGVFGAEMLRMEESGAVETAVDLSRLDFIDSSGMAALVETGQRFRTHGGYLRLVGGPRRFATTGRHIKGGRGRAVRLPTVPRPQAASTAA